MMTIRDSANAACDDVIGLLVRAGDHTLDATERTRLDTHLLTCEACRAALQTQHMAHTLLADAFTVEPPFGFATRVIAHLDAPAPHLLDRFDFRRWTWRVSPVAGGLFLAAWLIVAGTGTSSASAAGEVVSADSTDAEAVLWSDALDGADFVSLVWEADVAVPPAGVSGREEGPQ